MEATTREPRAAVVDAAALPGRTQLRDLLAATDPSSPGVEVLRKRPDCMVLRVPAPEGGTVVAKIWARPGAPGVLKRAVSLDPAACEYKALVRLRRYGAAVPRPVGYGRLPGALAPYTDAAFMEDLGPVEAATDFFKRMIAAGDAAGADAFEEGLIRTTEAILAAGLVDGDHSLVNMVVPASSGVPVRLDFELARRAPVPTMLPGLYGRMLGRLLGTYAFAVQPDAGRVSVFAKRLVGRLGVPRRIVTRANGVVRFLMERQARTCGIDTRLNYDW